MNNSVGTKGESKKGKQGSPYYNLHTTNSFDGEQDITLDFMYIKSFFITKI